MYAPHNVKPLNGTHETIVAKFGSRLSLNFRPQSKEIYLSPIGRFFDKPTYINFGVMIDGIEYGLDFGYRQKPFQYIEQHEYFDRAVFRCKDFELGLDCTFEFISPFVPQDKDICQNPSIYVVANIKRFIDRSIRADDNRIVTVFCDARMSDFQEYGNDLLMKSTYYLSDDHIHYQDTKYLRNFLNENPYHEKGIKGELMISSLDTNSYMDGKNICVDGRISQTQNFKTTFVISGYTNDDVLNVQGDLYKLIYVNKFSNVQAVMKDAKINAETFIERSTKFSELLNKSSIGEDFINLLGFSFRSFSSNTWWCLNKKGKEWFSVVEGDCLFHSTVDVEYNDGLFYYVLWPELLEHNFNNWALYKTKNGIAHDVGAILNAGKQGYPHQMEIEENSDYILMLYAYFKMYGKVDFAKKYIDLVEDLVRFNKSCDLTGNGLANKGTANTIDDSSDDVQFAEEQVYLGIKEYSAYKAAEKLLTFFGHYETAAMCKEEAAKIVETIETKAWCNDHYVVNLISSKGKISEYSLYQAEGGNVSEKGKDAYSIYTANGLLYLWLVGDDNDFKLNRLALDIISAHKECFTPYGDTHSSIDTSNVWISQNIWRDICAGYLNVDFSNNIQNYWQFEIYENTAGRGGCFIDTYGWNKLNYYPRGLTSIGYYFSALGLSINSLDKVIKINPSRVPCYIPILQFGDWNKLRVPYVRFSIEKGKIFYEIENEDLLKEYKIEIL